MEPVAQFQANHEFRTVIMWFRRDLRVDDNPALVAALNASALVIPVFIWAPEEEGQFQPGRCSRWWTKHSLVDLQQALAALGSRLIIRRSTDSTAALLKVVAEVGAQAVFFNHLYDPISLMRDHECKRGLTAGGVSHRTFNGDMLYEPWEVLDSNRQPYSTFDDFWNSVRAMPVPPPFPVSAPAAMPPVPALVSSMAVTEVDWFFTAEQEASSDQLKFKWKPGVGGAIAELERFASERLHVFEHDRAKVDRDSTSRLSPWVHIGSISVRYIFYRIRQCQAEWLATGVDRTRSCDDFLQQVGYREYSRYLSFHFPFIHERSLLRHLRACPWRIDQHAFKAWRQGQTGYPIVDAAMRELWSSGWCHNRARVVAASFLVKDLLLPWQWGLKHYWDAQIDADLECDALGWQYVSGGMSDAHPFSYMMDLECEARRFDPDGEYVRRWLPVLSRLPTEHIHAPWKAPPQVLAAADVELGCNYPAPIISRNDARTNVEYACSILDKCVVAQSSESSGRYPYRAPTYPAAIGGTGASSGAIPTGTGGGGGVATGTHVSAPQSEQQNLCGSGNNAAATQHYRTGGLGSGRTTGAGGPASGGVGGGSVEGVGADGGVSGQGQRRGSRSGSAGRDGTAAQASAPPSAPVSQMAAGAMAPPPAPSGAVYYHPGDAAGQQMLARIIQQQRRTRVAAAGRQDGSGTDRPQAQCRPGAPLQPPLPTPQQQNAAGHVLAPVGPTAGGFDGARDAAAAAAAWADRVETGEADDDAVALWQQQQMLQGGTAAFAFEQAMQLLLARRRMGDGVSIVSGDGGDGDGPDGLALDDENSEEVVSNTVNLNATAFTGASCHRHPAGTARGARQRGRAMPTGRGARHGDVPAAADDDDDDNHACGAGSPSGSGPPRSAGDEASPLLGEDLPEEEPEGRAAQRRRIDGGTRDRDSKGEEDDDDYMQCEDEGGSPDALQGDSADGGFTDGDDVKENEDAECDMQCRTLQGGVAGLAEGGSGSPSSQGNEGDLSLLVNQRVGRFVQQPHNRKRWDQTRRRFDEMDEDGMAESPPPPPLVEALPPRQRDGSAGRGCSVEAGPSLPCAARMMNPSGSIAGHALDTDMAGVAPPQPIGFSAAAGQHGLQKRRRSGSGSLDCA